MLSSFKLQLSAPVQRGQLCVGCFDGRNPSLVWASSAGRILTHCPHSVATSGAHFQGGGGGKEVRTFATNKRISALAVGSLSSTTRGDLGVGRSDGLAPLRSERGGDSGSSNSSSRSSGGSSSSTTSNRDVLIYSDESTLYVYDVEENSETFTAQAHDGIHSLLYAEAGEFGGSISVGSVGGGGGGGGGGGPNSSGNTSSPSALVVTGGTGSVQAFDKQGDETFWTVTGDTVRAMCFTDFDGDGKQELLVGCDDYEIRVFQSEESIHAMQETGRVIALSSLTRPNPTASRSCRSRSRKRGGAREGIAQQSSSTPGTSSRSFAYALSDGTVGVYEGTRRIWRSKRKHEVTAVACYDLDDDGVNEVVTGWRNGRIDVRSDATGEVIHSDHFGNGVAVSAISVADLRRTGVDELIVASAQGEVRGYRAMEAELAALATERKRLGAARGFTTSGDATSERGRIDSSSSGPGLSLGGDVAVAMKQGAQELERQKQVLLLELHGLESNLQQAKEAMNGGSGTESSMLSRVGKTFFKTSSSASSSSSSSSSIGSGGGTRDSSGASSGMSISGLAGLPPDTEVFASAHVNIMTGCLDVVAETNNDRAFLHAIFVSTQDDGGEGRRMGIAEGKPATAGSKQRKSRKGERNNGEEVGAGSGLFPGGKSSFAAHAATVAGHALIVPLPPFHGRIGGENSSSNLSRSGGTIGEESEGGSASTASSGGGARSAAPNDWRLGTKSAVAAMGRAVEIRIEALVAPRAQVGGVRGGREGKGRVFHIALSTLKLPVFHMFYLAAAQGETLPLPHPFRANSKDGVPNPEKLEIMAGGALQRPKSYVEFVLPDEIAKEGSGTDSSDKGGRSVVAHRKIAARVCEWINTSFNVHVGNRDGEMGGNGVVFSIRPKPCDGDQQGKQLLIDCAFRALCGSPLFIAVARTQSRSKDEGRNGGGGGGAGGGGLAKTTGPRVAEMSLVVRLYHDDAGVLGQVVQSLCSWLAVTNLPSRAHLPREMAMFSNLVSSLEQFNSIRLKLTAEMADETRIIKELAIRAEDSRLLSDISAMTASYKALRDLNGGLVMEYKKRANNHINLRGALRQLNAMIQKGAKLRRGAPQRRLVKACRSAVRANDMDKLRSIIERGV